MILTPRQLKHFENFIPTEGIKRTHKTTHRMEMFDGVTLTYIEDVPKVFGGTKERTWTQYYEVKRTEAPSDEEGYTSYTQAEDFRELKEQLEAIVSGKWEMISKENHEYFLDKYPERFV